MARGDLKAIKIEFPNRDPDDLRERLARTRWPALPPVDGWERGVPVAYLRRIAEYWERQFDWRAQEKELNELPHYAVTLDGQPFHFVHVGAGNKLPLLLLHGWPSSFVEYIDVIEHLADDFDLVIPSLPGHGLSSPLASSGWTDGRMADALIELMHRLGYREFGVQGGDIGAFVAPEIGRRAPERVVGVHVNAFITFPSDDEHELAALTESERARLERHRRFREDGMGYAQIQGTRPYTVAYGLTDSPVAQLAWIIEKFKEWTDPDRELPEDPLPIDRLLANVTLYWLTGTAGSAASLYYDRFHDPAMWMPKQRSTVPTAVAVYTTDVSIRRFAEAEHNIVRWTEHTTGGHFPALEAPADFAKDVREFFRDTAGGAGRRGARG